MLRYVGESKGGPPGKGGRGGECIPLSHRNR